jgi:hypothetical protein
MPQPKIVVTVDYLANHVSASQGILLCSAELSDTVPLAAASIAVAICSAGQTTSHVSTAAHN